MSIEQDKINNIVVFYGPSIQHCNSQFRSNPESTYMDSDVLASDMVIGGLRALRNNIPRDQYDTFVDQNDIHPGLIKLV